MANKKLTIVAFLVLPLLFMPASGRADSILGTSIVVTSVFNGQQAQQWNFADITDTRISAGVFSDWMFGPDTGTNIEFVPGVPNGDKTRNEVDFNFSGNTNFNNFLPADLLTLTLQLDPGFSFNTDFMAITIANDTQVPTSSVHDGTFTIDINGLDQINDNGGQLQIIFDVKPASSLTPTPEPSTLLLMLLPAGAIFLMKRRGSPAR